MIKQYNANKARLKRHLRMRNRIHGSPERPRLSVFRSGSQIYAQVIDDTTGRTLAAASSLEEALKNFKPAPQAAPKKEERTVEFEEVEIAAEAAPAKKGARAEKAAKAAPVYCQTKGRAPLQTKAVLASAQHAKKDTRVEALAAISNIHMDALAREVGK